MALGPSASASVVVTLSYLQVSPEGKAKPAGTTRPLAVTIGIAVAPPQ